MSPVLFVILGALATGPSAEPRLPSHFDFTPLRSVVVQHDGRWPPLDTVARDLVQSVTGRTDFRGHDAVAWLLAWTFDPETWMREPLITIRNAELRGELKLPADRTVFSFSELLAHAPLRAQFEALGRVDRGQKMDPLQKKVSDIYEKLQTLQNVFRGSVIRPIPDPNDARGAWTPLTAATALTPETESLQRSWTAVGDAYRRHDSAAFSSASQDFAAIASALPAAYRPAATLVDTELRYNQTAPFGLAWKVMLGGALLCGIAAVVRRQWFDAIALLTMIAGFVALTLGLALRWQIAGRIPASNMFESLLFLSWGMGAFAIVSALIFRHRLVPLTASGMGALALILAEVLPLDHFVRPIAPVLLDTVWMSIHVPIIMVSYSVLALAVLVAHLQLVSMAVVPAKTAWSKTFDDLHYWYVQVGTILLTAGIITGSMWAASSWGRYWGWDPKEVWSLVALLGYLTILHVRIDQQRVPAWAYFVGVILTIALLAVVVPQLAPLSSGKVMALAAMVVGMAVLVLASGPFATAAKSILCFWLIIMTYVGVNYVLGVGLHSYGFGTGAVVRYMFLLGGIELGFVALCTAVYVVRRWITARGVSPLPPAMAWTVA